MDRNQIIGLSLLTAIVFVWFWVMPSSPKKDTNTSPQTTAHPASSAEQSSASADKVVGDANSNASASLVVKDSFYVVTTPHLSLSFNLKGGVLTHAVLNQYKQSHDTSQHVFFDYDADWYQATALKKSNQQFFFQLLKDTIIDQQFRKIVLRTYDNKQSLTHTYTVHLATNLIDWSIDASDFSHWFVGKQIPFNYKATLYPSENTLSYELQMGNVGYNTAEDEYDFIRLEDNLDEELEEPVKWLSYKQRFFNSTFVATNSLISKAKIHASAQIEKEDEPFAIIHSNFEITHSDQPLNFAFYIGDNTYAKLAELPYKNMNAIIDYGSGMVSFVKYINRGLILPFFLWITSFITNMGWAIALLTIFIRILTSPLLYSSYLSSAKMRVLRPELEELKKRVGDDKQKYSLEQMELYRQAGVNPFGGCIPALLQIPIFFALYSFFNSHIQLRSVPFLWATDLSTYDTIVHLPFSIPFYGDHVSLFNITASITSFLISYFGTSMNQASPEMANNPALKYMPYIFPFILLFIFNNMPAALTWYYTISNSITLIIQLVINKFIIDHDKILKKIEENKKKRKGKSGLQQRMASWQQMKSEQGKK